MRRPLVLLLTVLVALASFASALHAMPHTAMKPLHAASPRAAVDRHAPVADATPCCPGETQRSVPSCSVLLAVLPHDVLAAPPTMRSKPSALVERHHDGTDPERLLDPPRA